MASSSSSTASGTGTSGRGSGRGRDSALDALRRRVRVDVDQLSPAVAQKYGPFCDMTSNQALLAGAIAQDLNADLVRRIVARAKLEKDEPIAAVEYAMDLLIVHLAKDVLRHLHPSGRVHAQISPRFALSYPLTLAHARRLISTFARDGIPPERVCLKIPATGAGLCAAAQLEREHSGVRTLATTLFSLPQALAAAQAGCLYVAPYFNELAVHFEPGVWKEYDRPEREHGMAREIRRVVCAYKRMNRGEGGVGVPLVMPASIVTGREAVGLGILGVDHLTLSGKVLEELEGMEDLYPSLEPPDFPTDAEADAALDADIHTDWLADEGAALDERIRSDPDVSRRLEYAVNAFLQCENQVAAVVRQLMQL